MNLRQAAEMALETLEDIFGKEKKDVGAINALREALAQPDEVLAEREAVIETIDELMGMESDRHPMFSEGYDYALDHIKQFVRGRDSRDKEEKNT